MLKLSQAFTGLSYFRGQEWRVRTKIISMVFLYHNFIEFLRVKFLYSRPLQFQKSIRKLYFSKVNSWNIPKMAHYEKKKSRRLKGFLRTENTAVMISFTIITQWKWKDMHRGNASASVGEFVFCAKPFPETIFYRH